MVGVLMKDAYKEQNVPIENLSRTLEDAGTMVLGFVPWGDLCYLLLRSA